ncbi:MAG: helix-turn-helix transcriptional regulator [Thermoanaerobaculia bacterium]
MTTHYSIERQLSRRFSPMARFRMARGLRQYDVALRADLHETTVGKAETGERLATPHQARQIARGLRTTLAQVRLLLAQSRNWARRSAEGRGRKS